MRAFSLDEKTIPAWETAAVKKNGGLRSPCAFQQPERADARLSFLRSRKPKPVLVHHANSIIRALLHSSQYEHVSFSCLLAADERLATSFFSRGT